MSKDVQELIESMRITPNWYKMQEEDVKAKRNADERGDKRRRGIY